MSEKWQEDPEFYKRFSQMLEEAIEAFRQLRLSDAEYLKHVTEIMQSVVNRTGEDVAKAFYGVILETLGKQDMAETRRSEVGAEAGLGCDHPHDEDCELGDERGYPKPDAKSHRGLLV